MSKKYLIYIEDVKNLFILYFKFFIIVFITCDASIPFETIIENRNNNQAVFNIIYNGRCERCWFHKLTCFSFFLIVAPSFAAITMAIDIFCNINKLDTGHIDWAKIYIIHNISHKLLQHIRPMIMDSHQYEKHHISCKLYSQLCIFF